jgi:hypothetical protein
MADATYTNVVGFAPEVAPYAQTLLGKTQALVDSPYQTYNQERIAQFNPLQQQSFMGAGQLGPASASLNAASGLQDYSQRAANTGYGPSSYGTNSFVQPGAADAYMSPYMQSVVDIQKREAARQSGIQGTQQQAQAAQAGAFGGGRDAIMRAERERNLGQQMGDIQAQGSQAAFQQAQQQFNAEQQARLNANQLNEQSRQFGAGLGLQGLQAGMQGMSNLGAIGQNIYGQQANALGIQNAFGGQQQQQTQNVLNQQYQDFLNQQNYPYKQLNFMSDIIRGTPTTTLGSSMYQQPPSLLNQVAGLGTAAAGLFGAYNQANKPAGSAKGGAIKAKKPQGGLPQLLINSMG